MTKRLIALKANPKRTSRSGMCSPKYDNSPAIRRPTTLQMMKQTL